MATRSGRVDRAQDDLVIANGQSTPSKRTVEIFKDQLKSSDSSANAVLTGFSAEGWSSFVRGMSCASRFRLSDGSSGQRISFNGARIAGCTKARSVVVRAMLRW